MKHIISIFQQKWIYFSSALFVSFFAHAPFLAACQGCKVSMEEHSEAAAAGIGFSSTIVFMISMPVLIISFISWMSYKNCRQIAAARSAASSSRE